MDLSAPAPRCPVCGGAMEPPVRSCPACGTEHHAQCWQNIGGCAIFDCKKHAFPPPLLNVTRVEAERQRPPTQFSLATLLTVPVVLAALAGLLVPALQDGRKRSKVTDCKGNMKQLGIYLNTYVSRYGSDTYYPNCAPPPALAGAPRSRGTNGSFWSHLWLLPNPRVSVAHRPGDDGLFFCRVHGGSYSTTELDYAGPNLANTQAFPGGRLSDRVYPNVYIGGDLLLLGDCNHGDDSGGPNYDWNGLRFDGSVQNIPPSRPLAEDTEHARYIHETDALTGVRTP